MENLYETTVERYRNYVMPTYAPKILFTRGQGARLWTPTTENISISHPAFPSATSGIAIRA